MRHCVCCGFEVGQAAFLGFLDPGVVVAVAVEDDTLVSFDGVADQVVDIVLKVLGVLQNIRELF